MGKTARVTPVARIALGVIVSVEAIAVTVFTFFLAQSLFRGEVEHLPTAIAVTLLAVLASAAVIAIAVAVFRNATWARSATLTVQILTLAVGVGTVQGATAQPLQGLLIIILAVTAGVLSLRMRPADAEPAEREG